MEYVEGKDLAEVLEQRGRMRVTDALAITKRVCSALAAAHAMGIVHRDIKPANILITHEKVKVADFGLSRHLDGDSHMTQPGHIMGTPHYMSPEQCMGLPLDVRTDLYSVGASLYHMLAGRVPYTANTPIGVLQMHVDQDTHPEPLRQIDPELPQSVADVVTRLMGHQPSDRFSTAREAAEAIDVVLRSVRGTAPPPKPVVPWLFYACVAAALVVGLSLAFQFNRSPRKAPTTSGENKTTMPDGEPRAPKIDRPSD